VVPTNSARIGPGTRRFDPPEGIVNGRNRCTKDRRGRGSEKRHEDHAGYIHACLHPVQCMFNLLAQPQGSNKSRALRAFGKPCLLQRK